MKIWLETKSPGEDKPACERRSCEKSMKEVQHSAGPLSLRSVVSLMPLGNKMKLLLISILAGIVATIGVLRLGRNEVAEKKKKIEKAFADRPQQSPTDFYASFFRSTGIPEHVVVGVRNILEEQLDADLSRMVDSDDFSKNLSFFWEFDSMADVEVVCALEQEFQIKITDEEAANAQTVRDIVDLVWRKVKEKA